MGYVFQFGEVTRYWDWLVSGIAVTLLYSFAGVALSLIVGCLGALAMRSRFRTIRWIVQLYVHVIRNTPFFVQLLILFFGLSSVGLRLNALTAGMVGLVMYNGAFMVEIIRSGLQAIHPSQLESGLSIGMTRPQ